MKTTTSTPIPTLVIDRVTKHISMYYPTLNENQKVKLFSKLLELWFLILVEHDKEKSDKEKEFINSTLDNIYVNIPKDKLKCFRIRVGKVLQYSDLIKILINCELIDVNNSYEVGNFPKSYRPNPLIKFKSMQIVNLDLSKIVNFNKTKAQLINDNPKYIKLIESLYLVNIDLIEFYNKVDSMIGKVYKQNKGKDIILDDKMALRLKISVIKVELGIHFFKVTSTGRIYSSISNLPKLALPYLTLNGKSVVEIDAANCQPLLLASMVINDKFKKDCESGQFYETLSYYLGLSREETKLKSYSEIFFNNKKIKKSIGLILDAAYPGLTDQINQYKAKSKKEADSWKNAGQESRLLWFQLQTLESSIFINTALDQITPVITRHDSILCFENEVDTITESIKNRFNKLGIKVTLK